MATYGVDNVFKAREIQDKLRKTKEQLGLQLPLNQISNYSQYRRLITKETKKWRKQLFKNWNGICYYTGEKLLIDKKQYLNKKYRTIDHKISIIYGFLNNISYLIIGNISNLCICSRSINCHKKGNCQL